jgi:hypothetical protein
MYDYLVLEGAKARHEGFLRDAQTFRRALRSRKLDRSSPILKSLIIFLIAVA